MVAEDYSDSLVGAKAIYQVIRDRLLKAPREKLLPLVYTVDSIIKNARGHYIAIVENDAENWIPSVYTQLQDAQKDKFQRMWKTWNDARIFSPERLKSMGRCFDDKASGNSLSSSTSQVAGINRTVRLSNNDNNNGCRKFLYHIRKTHPLRFRYFQNVLQKDGTLLLPKTLREEMDNILEDMQKDVPEREKVSLERLAEVNPKLLGNIKEIAHENLRSAPGSNGTIATSSKKDENRLPAFFTETRSPTMIQYTASWKEHNMDVFKEAKIATDGISNHVENVYKGRYTQNEALEVTEFAATASAVATFLTRVVEMMQEDEAAKKTNPKMVSGPSSGFRVDPALFTNEGIKQKNTAVVGILYEVGLPFQSSADGRRFRTQMELSKHLDALFKRAQIEKSITRAEERGWYVSDAAWQGEAEDTATQGLDMSSANDPTATAAEDGYDPETSAVPADENRDHCVVCGLNFKMFFDNEDGIYQYKNCREIEVLNDEVALNESESMLVHVSCWRALGSPEVLTMDQALQDTVRH